MGGYYPVQLSKAQPRGGYQAPRRSVFPANQNVGRAQPGPTNIPGLPAGSPRITPALERGVRMAILRGVARVGSRLIPGLNVAEAILEAMYYWYRYNESHLAPGIVGYNTGGFTQCPPPVCAGRVATHLDWSSNTMCAALHCGLVGQFRNVAALDATIPANIPCIHFWQQDSPSGWSFVAQYIRAVPAPAVKLQYKIDPRYFEEPSWIPSVYPETIPIATPVAPPLPAPLRQLKARRNYRLGMAEARQAGYQLGRVAFGASPAPPGSVIMDFRPDGRVKTRITKVPHRKIRPKRGERERKGNSLNRNMGVQQAVVLGALTESDDALVAIWNALPYEYRKSRSRNEFYYWKKEARWMLPSRDMMIDDLWDHPEKIDLQKMAFNLTVEFAEDFLIGDLSRAAHKSWYKSAFGALRAPRPGPYLSFTN